MKLKIEKDNGCIVLIDDKVFIRFSKTKSAKDFIKTIRKQRIKTLDELVKFVENWREY